LEKKADKEKCKTIELQTVEGKYPIEICTRESDEKSNKKK
jgi:hypothetical protein